MDALHNQLEQNVAASRQRGLSPAGQAVFLLAAPFTLLEALHYDAEGTALLFSFPFVLVACMLCGMLAAKLARRAGLSNRAVLTMAWRAGFRFWLVSIVINSVFALLLGSLSPGAELLPVLVFLCFSAPLQALGSALAGWLGGCLWMRVLSTDGG